MRLRAAYWQVPVLGFALLLLLVLWVVAPRSSAPAGQSWLLLSRPGVQIRTNLGVSVPTITVRVSNVGPRAVDFRLCWFECRARLQRTLLATNRFESLIIPLSPGKSTNLTMDVALKDVPVEECWSCGEVLWAERESTAVHVRWKLDSLLNRFDLPALPYSTDLRHGSAIAGNVDVAEYLEKMYGRKYSEWLAVARKVPSLLEQPKNNGIYFPVTPSTYPSPEERAQLAAQMAFSDFCRTLATAQTNSLTP